MRLIALLFVFTFVGSSVGQGTIRGLVKDHVTNEPVPFALVKVEGQNAGANTDFDGEYEIKIKAGSYTLIFSMSADGYLSQHKEIEVKEGEVLILNVILSKGQEFVEVIAQGYKTDVPDNRAAADKNRREEKGATDGVTKEEMNEKGVVTVADALQTAPGLSVEEGKNVYVRGLGDRYTKTILNGMEIPGLDPDRNSVQLDIFPASVVDNITVYKTFLPNFSGDYTGGLVDITTKDFPAERTFYTKLGLGYNTKATFNKDYLSYQGGSLDFLGFDDGTRALAVRETDRVPNPVLGDPKLESLTRKFSDVMATEKSSNFLNINYAITYGDRLTIKMKHKEKATYGYNLVLNYRNTNTYYSDVKFSEWRKGFDGNGDPVNELEQFRGSTGSLSENEVMWTALLGQSFKYKRSKISLSLFHTQNGKSSASMLTEVNYEQNPSTLAKQSLQYSQRSVSNANISGKHYLDTLAKWKLEWKLSPTYSLIKDPDIRSTVLQVLDEKGPNGETLYDYAPAVGSEIRRIWRNLE